MSEFSNVLSLFIKTRDVNVSALTAYCELDRSTMYKLINGKRSPSSKALVQKLASFMNLNPLETQELIQAYLLSKVGWEIYYSRKNVLEFLLSFADVRSEALFSQIPLLLPLISILQWQKKGLLHCPANFKLWLL